jgi:cytochrome c peroxidase
VRPFDPTPRDVGLMAESDRLEDAYRFRTPSLRNVAATGPWGHNGAYATLDGIVRHHLDPIGALTRWDRSQVVMPRDAAYEPTDFAVWSDARELQRYRSRLDIAPIALEDGEVAALLAFLESLTDEAALAGRLGKPKSVPSGLPVD